MEIRFHGYKSKAISDDPSIFTLIHFPFPHLLFNKASFCDFSIIDHNFSMIFNLT